MKIPSDKVLPGMKRAAELRAEGFSWKVIGHELRRKPATCARWPVLYPGVWKELLQAARRNAEVESSSEAQSMLRTLLRGKDDKTRLSAAAHLLKPRRPLRRARRPLSAAERELAEFITEVKGLSDEELESTIGEFLAAGGGAAGVADATGAA